MAKPIDFDMDAEDREMFESLNRIFLDKSGKPRAGVREQLGLAKREDAYQDALVWGPFRVKKAAVEFLLFQIRVEPRGKAKSYFESGKYDKCIEDLKDPTGGKDMEYLRAMCDDIIHDNRHNAVGARDIEEVLRNVAECIELLDRYPELEDVCKDEALVLRNHKRIRKYSPAE